MLATTTLAIVLIVSAAIMKHHRQLEIIALNRMCHSLKSILSVYESIPMTSDSSGRKLIQEKIEQMRRDMANAELDLLKAIFPKL